MPSQQVEILYQEDIYITVNIPLDVRDMIDEIPKDKEIYVSCQVGFRGYLAERILDQK